MISHLFFICPTDNLIPRIEKDFSEENYFYTSLANRVSFDVGVIEKIKGLIETKNIREITFVLSEDNKIIKDVLSNCNYANSRGLGGFYSKMIRKQKSFDVLFQKKNLIRPIVSHYLNTKVEELEEELDDCWFSSLLNVNAKIYDREENKFINISSEIFYKENFALN